MGEPFLPVAFLFEVGEGDEEVFLELMDVGVDGGADEFAVHAAVFFWDPAVLECFEDALDESGLEGSVIGVGAEIGEDEIFTVGCFPDDALIDVEADVGAVELVYGDNSGVGEDPFVTGGDLGGDDAALSNGFTDEGGFELGEVFDFDHELFPGSFGVIWVVGLPIGGRGVNIMGVELVFGAVGKIEVLIAAEFTVALLFEFLHSASAAICNSSDVNFLPAPGHILPFLVFV